MCTVFSRKFSDQTGSFSAQMRILRKLLLIVAISELRQNRGCFFLPRISRKCMRRLQIRSETKIDFRLSRLGNMKLIVLIWEKYTNGATPGYSQNAVQRANRVCFGARKVAYLIGNFPPDTTNQGRFAHELGKRMKNRIFRKITENSLLEFSKLRRRTC